MWSTGNNWPRTSHVGKIRTRHRDKWYCRKMHKTEVCGICKHRGFTQGDATEVRGYFMEDFKCIEESRNPEFSKSGRDLRCSRFFACVWLASSWYKTETPCPYAFLPIFCRKKVHPLSTNAVARLAEWETIIIPKSTHVFSWLHARRPRSYLWRLLLRLEALLHSRGDSSEVAVDLGRRATQNEGNNGGTCHVDVLESCRDSQRDAARYNVSISTYHPRCESSNLRVPRGSCLRSQ